jgi:hypothetical protein
MPTDDNDFSVSTLSLSSSSSQEDWDRSSFDINSNASTTTPRNSVLFPADGGHDQTPGRPLSPKPDGSGKRSISELLRIHAEKGTNVKFSAEEASRVAEVLGQWVIRTSFAAAFELSGRLVFQTHAFSPYQINSESSPYEAEDDFFSRSKDHLSSSLAPLTAGKRTASSSSHSRSRPGSSAGIKT